MIVYSLVIVQFLGQIQLCCSPVFLALQPCIYAFICATSSWATSALISVVITCHESEINLRRLFLWHKMVKERRDRVMMGYIFSLKVMRCGWSQCERGDRPREREREKRRSWTPDSIMKAHYHCVRMHTYSHILTHLHCWPGGFQCAPSLH